MWYVWVGTGGWCTWPSQRPVLSETMRAVLIARHRRGRGGERVGRSLLSGPCGRRRGAGASACSLRLRLRSRGWWRPSTRVRCASFPPPPLPVRLSAARVGGPVRYCYSTLVATIQSYWIEWVLHPGYLEPGVRRSPRPFRHLDGAHRRHCCCCSARQQALSTSGRRRRRTLAPTLVPNSPARSAERRSPVTQRRCDGGGLNHRHTCRPAVYVVSDASDPHKPRKGGGSGRVGPPWRRRRGGATTRPWWGAAESLSSGRRPSPLSSTTCSHSAGRLPEDGDRRVAAAPQR